MKLSDGIVALLLFVSAIVIGTILMFKGML